MYVRGYLQGSENGRVVKIVPLMPSLASNDVMCLYKRMLECVPLMPPTPRFQYAMYLYKRMSESVLLITLPLASNNAMCLYKRMSECVPLMPPPPPPPPSLPTTPCVYTKEWQNVCH